MRYVYKTANSQQTYDLPHRCIYLYIPINNMKYLHKASEEHNEFYDLIGMEVTFAKDIVNDSGMLLFEKSDKAVVTDIVYVPGHYHKRLPDLWIKPEISLVEIENYNQVKWTWIAPTFEEHKFGFAHSDTNAQNLILKLS